MPSHLTRGVFRRLLANEPIVHRGCLRRQHYSPILAARIPLQAATLRNGKQAALYEQRRHFFNFNLFGKKHEKQEATLDPGIEKMMELAKRQRMRARMPEATDVSLALEDFLAAKNKQLQPMTDTQAQLVLKSLKYLISVADMSAGGSSAMKQCISAEVLEQAARVLARTRAVTRAHRDLAQALYQQLSLMNDVHGTYYALRSYIKILSLSGMTVKAHELVTQMEQESRNGPRLRKQDDAYPGGLTETVEAEQAAKVSLGGMLADMWRTLLEGYVKEENDARVQETLAILSARGYELNRIVCAAMIDHSLTRNDLDAIKHWWRTYRERTPDEKYSNEIRDGQLLHKILRWCLAKSELQTGHEIVKEAMMINPPKPVWDAIFVWAAGTRKGVDEINRMIGVMEKMNETIPDEKSWRVADNATINSLVEFAVSVKDPYMAERFITLGRERNIQPDARTFALQMEYRLSVGDVDGALIAYKTLAEQRDTIYTEEDSVRDDETIINHLVVAMCRSQRHDFETIMNVTMDLADRKARFEADTVSELTLLHLRRDEHEDATDLLNTHAFQFSSAERAVVRESIIGFALKPETAISRAWDSYRIVNEVFDETDREQRTQLMMSFFDRERADLGVRIFQQMRMHSRSDTFPTVDTYKSALLGLAKLRDLESVEVVHNLLKLDFNITVTTYLRNALIIAFTACGRGRKALGFWDEIVASKEGPSYNSIHIALRACEKSPFGDMRAKELWGLLRRRNVELDQTLWASYAAALAGNGDVDLAITTVEDAEAKGEVEVDAFLIGSLFAGAAGQVKQLEVELWAKENYPSQWEGLEALGVETEENEMRAFKIDRRVAP